MNIYVTPKKFVDCILPSSSSLIMKNLVGIQSAYDMPICLLEVSKASLLFIVDMPIIIKAKCRRQFWRYTDTATKRSARTPARSLRTHCPRVLADCLNYSVVPAQNSQVSSVGLIGHKGPGNVNTNMRWPHPTELDD